MPAPVVARVLPGKAPTRDLRQTLEKVPTNKDHQAFAAWVGRRVGCGYSASGGGAPAPGWPRVVRGWRLGGWLR